MAIKAADVRYNLRDANLHPEVLKVLVKLAEDVHEHDKLMLEYATMLNRMLDLVKTHDLVAQNMAGVLQKLEGKARMNVDVKSEEPT